MNISDFEKSKTSRPFWPVLGLLVTAVITTAKQQDASVLAVGILLGVVSVYPFYFWLINWSRGLPAWPLFCAVTGLTAAMPMFQDTQNLHDYTAMEITTGGMTMTGFILLGTIVWLSMTARKHVRPARILMISRAHAERYLLGFLALGVAYHFNAFTGWVQLPGNLMQVMRGLTGALSMAAIFTLAFQHGRGALRMPAVVAYLTMSVLTVCFILTGLLLAQAIAPVALAVFGYTLGKGRFPWKTAVVCLVVLTLLQPGKYLMREKYWGEASQALELQAVPGYFIEWIGYGFDAMGANVGLRNPMPEEKSATTLFERSGTLHMLLLVQQKSPNVVPFLNGLTYEPIPRLLMPRFIDDQKGKSHAGNVMLTVNYGLQTLEQTASTSIHWGLVPEAYANFGYLGVAALAILLGAFYAFVGNLTEGVPLTSLRFVLGILIMGAASRADTMGVFVTSQFQGVVGACLGAALLMTRQPNPLAGQRDPGIKRQTDKETKRRVFEPEAKPEVASGQTARGTAEGKRRDQEASLRTGGKAGDSLRVNSTRHSRGQTKGLRHVARWEGGKMKRSEGGKVDKSEAEKVGTWERGMAAECEEMKARLRRIYGTYRPLPKWASFRHRAIMLEIEKLEAQLKQYGPAERLKDKETKSLRD